MNKSLNELTQLTTAFPSWEKLEAAMTSGYVPTLEAYPGKDVATQKRNQAVIELRVRLRAMGYEVFALV